jgi:hypothetical protein
MTRDEASLASALRRRDARGKEDWMKLSSMLARCAVVGALLASPVLALSPAAAAAGGAPTSGTIEGTVASVERESGRFVLDTNDGPISLVTSPDELTGVEVGDVVQVTLLGDDDN